MNFAPQSTKFLLPLTNTGFLSKDILIFNKKKHCSQGTVIKLQRSPVF